MRFSDGKGFAKGRIQVSCHREGTVRMTNKLGGIITLLGTSAGCLLMGCPSSVF